MVAGSADLQKRTLFIGLPVAVLTIAGSGWVASRVIDREFERTAESRLAATARRAAATARFYLDERQIALSLLATAPSVRDVASAATAASAAQGFDRLPTDALRERLAESPPSPPDPGTERFLSGYASQSDMVDLVLTDRYGITAFALHPQLDPVRSGEAWWQEGMRTGEALHWHRDTVAGAPPTAAFTVRVLDPESGTPLGILRGDVPLAALSRVLAMDQAGIVAELVDSAGVIVASADSTRVLRELEDATVIERGTRARVTRVENARVGRQLAATAPTGIAGWWVVLREEEAVTYAAARSLQRILLTGAAVVGVIVVLMILWITYWMEQKITRPIRTAGNIAGRVAAGELTVQVNPEGAGSQEIGALLTSIGSMVVALRDLVGRIRTASEESAAMAQEISASTEEMSASTEEMAATCQNLTEQATQQAGMVRSAADDARRILSITTTLADGATVAADRNTSLLEVAERHRERLLGGGETLVELARDLEQGLADARRLAGMSVEIEAFVKQSRAIASQTNMLALNAAIEASRASGGEGRGFGVVADEVRKLASQAARSAGSTSETVQNVLATLTATVERLTRLAEASQQVREIAEAAAGGLQEVASGAAETSAWTGEISGAAGEVQRLVEEISKRLTTISHATDSVVAAAEEIAASAEEQSASTQEIASSATHLAEAAEHLTEAVSSFATG